MKSSKTLLLLLLTISSVSFGQKFNFEENVLTDSDYSISKIDTSSQLFILSKVNGVELIEINVRNCDNNIIKRVNKASLITYSSSNDTTRILVGFSEICCVSFEVDVLYMMASIDLLYSKFGPECECECCYNLEYVIKTNKKFNQISLNGKLIFTQIDK